MWYKKATSLVSLKATVYCVCLSRLSRLSRPTCYVTWSVWVGNLQGWYSKERLDIDADRHFTKAGPALRGDLPSIVPIS